MTVKTARPKTCHAMSLVDPALGEAKCRRLPRHQGSHRVTLHEVKVAKSAKPKASIKVVTIGGTKFQVKFGSDGSAVLTPIVAKVSTPVVTIVPEVSPKGNRVQPQKAAKRRGNVYITSGKPSARLA